MMLQEGAYHPHGFCYLWEPGLVWTHVVADGLIATAYFSIPLGLIWFLRRRPDIPFDKIIVAFAVFILACGATHVMGIWTLWRPDFWTAAWVKVLTAGASLATAVLMVPFIPKAVAFPSPSQLAERNQALEREVAERRAVEKQLETRNQELDAFAYTVSHDLKAPLRAMEGFSAALLEDCSASLDPTCADYARRIQAGAGRMGVMIRDLLDYSRLARADIELQPIKLESVVRSSLDSVAGLVEEATVRANVDEDLVVLAHADTLGRVVTNLVQNALTYVSPGERPRVEVSAVASEDTVRLSVQDEGIGIEAAHHAKIFDVFERLHGIEEYAGTGIGLAIVAKGMERMGGRVGVESEPGAGSRFWIELERGS